MRSTQAITLVEALVAVAIIGIILVFVMQTQTLFFASARTSMETTKATYLAEEGQELVRYLRDADWNQIAALSTGSPHYFNVTGSGVTITSTPEVIDSRYTRSFTLTSLSRSASGDFVSSGGTSDTGSRVVTVDIDWNGTKVSLKGIVTNMHNI